MGGQKRLYRMKSISQAYPERAGGSSKIAIGTNGFQSADGFLDGHRADLRSLKGDHFAEISGFDKFHGMCTENRAKRAIEACGAAAALQVSEHACPCFLAGA